MHTFKPLCSYKFSYKGYYVHVCERKFTCETLVLYVS